MQRYKSIREKKGEERENLKKEQEGLKKNLLIELNNIIIYFTWLLMALFPARSSPSFIIFT